MGPALEQRRNQAVVCVFCGNSTLLQAAAQRREGSDPGEPSSGLRIVRCSACGKEAVYLPEEIVDLQEPGMPSHL
jgi:hypothetical protein